jgi:hypothetical protein
MLGIDFFEIVGRLTVHHCSELASTKRIILVATAAQIVSKERSLTSNRKKCTVYILRESCSPK